MPRKKEYMTVNDFAVQVTLTEGKKVNLTIAQVKEVIRIMRSKIIGITENRIKLAEMDGTLSFPKPKVDLYDIIKSVKLT